MRKRNTILLLLMCYLVGTASCRSASPPKTVEVTATSAGAGDAFVLEHSDLFAENIRLKAALKLCREGH